MKLRIKALSSLLSRENLLDEAKMAGEVIKSSAKELHIYDFDNTLFRAPSEPLLWSKNKWWYAIDSLIPPCVPETPDSSWWIEPIVNSARISFNSSNVYSVMLTGRQENVYGERVRKMLEDKKIHFDEIHLSDRSDAKDFKSSFLKEFLSRNKEFESVTIWDDRELFLKIYKEVILSINPSIEVTTNLVMEAAKGSLCEEDPQNFNLPKSPSSISFFLDSESKGKVLGSFPPSFLYMFNNNIEVIKKPSNKDIERYKEFFGNFFEIKVVGEIKTEDLQVLVVNLDHFDFPELITPHIILSSMNRKISKSSLEECLKQKPTKYDGPLLKGFLWMK